jgi:anti-sigma factor ChrR (cupin superfamily)
MTRRKGKPESEQADFEALRATLEDFADWPADALRPRDSLWDRLARKLQEEGAGEPLPRTASTPEQEWEEVAPGISCKLLATDREHHRVTMLVRLAPGVAYPPHVHAGIEELHLLDGELWIDDRKLVPGDYNRGEPGASDHRVWSETGCTCVLITSPRDRLL